MPPAFEPFNPRREFLSTHRNLPHWQQPDVTYFVTFRLADCLPAGVRQRFEEMRRLNDAEAFAWIEHYLDAGSGGCPLSNPVHANTVASSLRHFDGKRYALGAFVVMPNHVHALVQPVSPVTLPSIMHSWKSYTAHEFQRQAGIPGCIWQQESFDRIVRDEMELAKFHDYIFANPVKARLLPGSFIADQGSAKWLGNRM